MRRGVTIVEVLFAVMVTTIGLLGAISVFVVAGSQYKKAVTNDAAAATGRAAAHTFKTMRMNDATRWYTWDTTASRFTAVATAAGFVSPFQAFHSYCIDSRYVVANTANWTAASVFPCNSPTNPSGPRMRRVAYLSVPTATLASHQMFADHVFLMTDDLLVSRSDKDRAIPAEQVFLSDSTGLPVRRETEGRVSWMATVVPGIAANGTAWTSTGKATLSVVVLKDRPMEAVLDKMSERALAITLQGGGEGGGEVLLTSTDAELLKVRANQWLMLSGMKPLKDSTGAVVDNVARFAWYRVASTEPEASPSGGTFQLNASLTGGDIDPELTGMQAVFVDGVVTVHERTIKVLDGTSL